MISRHVALARSTVLPEQRQVRVIVSTESIGRDELIVQTNGIDLTAYRQNPVVLWQHDVDHPIARALTIEVMNGSLVALVQFPRPGISPMADEASD